MCRPNPLKEYDEIDLKLGIKSSLPKVRSTLALAIILAEVTNLDSEIFYSESCDDKIQISNDLKKKILTKFSEILISNNIVEELFFEMINDNALFKAQLESLKVAFELIWKYAKIEFVANIPASSERTGGKRYEKVLHLTTNADLLHNVMSSDWDSYYTVLLKWLGLPMSIDEKIEKKLISTLSIFSEEAIFKLIDGNEELIFNQEGIYQALLDNHKGVNLKSDIEAKGSLRILNSLLKESLNPHFKYNNYIASEQDDKSEELNHYAERVGNYLKLISKKNDTSIQIEREIVSVSEEKILTDLVFNTSLETNFSYNRIIFGAPGTGKSYTINRDKDELLSNGGEFERVTFHEDYSYAHFVGTYKPTVIERDNVSESFSGGNEHILSILKDLNLNGQEKYDQLYETFKDNDLTILPILIGLYSNDLVNTKKKDGSDTIDNNRVERNHGRAIRSFVNLIDEKKNSNEITYEYVPGPFMRMYVKALKNARTGNPKPHVLIIEEINRASVARVFGDVFQLLDRDSDNVSEYPIEASEDIKKYLLKELGVRPDDYGKIKIPNNMFLWATMNSADQGVKPMDTAFKRRWDFDYLGIDEGEEKISGKKVILGKGDDKRFVEWNILRKAINEELVRYKVNEDKLLGPFFLSLKVLGEGESIESSKFIKSFKNKILMYLFEDAAKAKRKSLFIGAGDDYNRYSAVVKAFDENGVFLFGPSIYEKFYSESERD